MRRRGDPRGTEAADRKGRHLLRAGFRDVTGGRDARYQERQDPGRQFCCLHPDRARSERSGYCNQSVHRGCYYCRRRAWTGSRSYREQSQLTRSVSLLVPGLAADFSGYADDVFPTAPALTRWLSRSRRVDFPHTDADSAACALFGLDAECTPTAALTYLADFSEPPPGICLRLDPVHLRADTSGLVLFAAESAGITEEESRALFEAIRPWLEEEGWTLRYGAADRWYVSSAASCPVPSTHPLTRVLGQPVSTCLPDGEGADSWLRRINELQMELHGHAVNQQRASRGQPLISGLWLWGGGQMPAAGKTQYSWLQTTRSVLSGLAHLHEVPQYGVAIDAGSLPADDGALLVDLELCESAAASDDVQRWVSAIEQLEHDWFAPLLASLMRGTVRQLELLPLDGFCYPLQRIDLLAFWRRRRDYRMLVKR